MTNNQKLLAWVDEMTTLCQPDDVVWFDGSKEQQDQILEDLKKRDAIITLNQDKLPNCYLFRSHVSDVARVEERTFIASASEEDAGPTNNWYEPTALKEKMHALYSGSMKGRTLYVIPFCMGPIDSPSSRIGVQITDSPYVVLNMKIMARTGQPVLDRLGDDGFFVPCLHSVGYPLTDGKEDVAWPCAPMEEKYIAHFPETREIWSYGSGYGGNALLGKKCLALRIASVMARDEGWMAEHMLILKLTNPEGEVRHICAAFPSACGKTNLAMLVPSLSGWKVETIGDDIAWLHIGKDGRLYAINPENGFFGVAPGTSMRSNPNAIKTIGKNTIFTNVALTDDNEVWWEGLSPAPEHLIDWQGQDWTRESGTRAAHPNSRFTAPAAQCPTIAPDWQAPEGVPIDAILFGGRRPSTIPLVYESFNWQHGVFLGSIMGSEVTAAIISDQLGKVRRDPFAMLPFIGYHVADYIQHWLDMAKLTDESKLPKIYSVNWFRKDEDGQFIWPGYGENIRVLEWIFERTAGQAGAKKTAIGNVPNIKDLNTAGLNVSNEDVDTLLDIDKDAWLTEAQSIRAHFDSYGQKMPQVLYDELQGLEDRLNDMD
ncbi:MAG: phosphoenolpyruvate carboxykinase (GTP) [Peptococcaceae bacterium]|nr:phosphoenolpyruvate carboxykinase (GTP) [Peptococcaceae bacterium]